LKAGDTAPPFVLNDANGNVVPASALLAQLLAISPQNVANSRESMRDNGLDFPILSDPSKETAAACGLRVALPGYLADVYKSRKNDLPAFNGDTSWTLPMPGHFVIGQDGIIRYAEINGDYTRRPEPSDMLPVLRTQGRPVSHSGAARPGLVPAALPTSKCTT
jgi:peroxiredoxin